MPTDLLKQFGLSRNPFTDRTAEKSYLDPLSLYIHSDLRGFRPSETTYVFFGRRGSGEGNSTGLEPRSVLCGPRACAENMHALRHGRSMALC